MARGRFLSKEIVDDIAFADISLKAYALFLSAIPHLDVEGRLKGNPRQVKRIVVGMRNDFEIDDITKILEELHEAGLIVWYEIDKKQYLYFPAFTESQPGLRKDREAASVIPPPGERKSIPADIRIQVFNRDNDICQYCGKVGIRIFRWGYPCVVEPSQERIIEEGKLDNGLDIIPFEIDHVLPVIHGGSNHIDNLSLSCRKCNRARGNQMRTPPVP